MSSYFKEVREKRGISLAEISDHLKIQKRYLQAIEDGDFSQLPGGVYSVGFVKSYANFLKLDAEKAVKDFEQWLLNPKEKLIRAEIEENFDDISNNGNNEEKISAVEGCGPNNTNTTKLIIVLSIFALILIVCAFI